MTILAGNCLKRKTSPGASLIFLVFRCWSIWRMITCWPLTLWQCFINTAQYLLSLLSKTLPNTCSQCSEWSFLSPSYLKVLLYASASSLSKSSRFLILKFLVKCCKLLSVFKTPSKSHMLDLVLISSVYYRYLYKLWFHSHKVFK